jgi:pyridoxine 5-phosphate synthase
VPEQIAAAAEAGFEACEIHTGPYAHATNVDFEIEKVTLAAGQITDTGMRFNAGHALNYLNVSAIAAVQNLWQLHIGHAIVSRAIFIGLREAVSEMQVLIKKAT